MKTQKKPLAAGLLAIGLFAGCTANASSIDYDFTVYLAGLGAGGPWDGSFDYSLEAISNFSFLGQQWSTLPSQGDVLSFEDGADNVLTTTLYTPLGGPTATASDFVLHFAAGGYSGWCAGSGFCDDGPVTFTAVKTTAAPELDSGSVASAITLLLGGIAVMQGRRRKTCACGDGLAART